MERVGTSDFQITLGAPRHLDVIGDCCYVVVPATMTYIRAGATRTQDNSTFTGALRNVEGRWLITAWAWSKGG